MQNAQKSITSKITFKPKCKIDEQFCLFQGCLMLFGTAYQLNNGSLSSVPW